VSVTSIDTTVASLRTLVGFATESRRSNLDLIGWYADRAVKAGGSARMISGGDDGRANLLVRFGPNAPGGLFLSGHTDVVPAGEGWSSDPYAIDDRDGRLYGRGAADMKGFLAAAIDALAGVPVRDLTAPVYLGLSYDEEIGCRGVRSLLDHLRVDASIAPDVVLIGEPTEMRVANSHAGKRAYDVHLRAAAGHSSRANVEPNAVLAAAQLAVEVDAVQRRRRASAPYVSTNIGRISGGLAVNVLAPVADISFEIRHGAGLDADALLAPVWERSREIGQRLAAVGGGVEVVETISYPALHTDCGAGAAAAVGAICALAGTSEPAAIDFGTEGGLYADAIPAPVLICGPGSIRDAHRPDEFVTIEQLARCRSTLERAVTEICVRGMHRPAG
jgi:acetylornithine deacetylase